jgi:hypothetical protein
MALNLDEFKADLLEIRDDLPVTFAFNGTTYTGFAGQKTTRETLEPGGFLDDLDRNLNVPVFTATASGSFTNSFRGPTPGLGDTLVIVSDGTYRVDRTARSQDNLLLSYGLNTTNR